MRSGPLGVIVVYTANDLPDLLNLAQLVVPVGNGDAAAVLVTLLRELVPSETAPVASAAP